MIFLVAFLSKYKFADTCRLLDTNSGEIRNIHRDDLTRALISNSNIKIANADVINGKLHGTQGRLDRYTHLELTGEPRWENSVIILCKVIEESGGISYIISGYDGAMHRVTEKSLVGMQVNSTEIANGKILNGHIIPIAGKFMEIREQKGTEGNKNKMEKSKENYCNDKLNKDMHSNKLFKITDTNSDNVLIAGSFGITKGREALSYISNTVCWLDGIGVNAVRSNYHIKFEWLRHLGYYPYGKHKQIAAYNRLYYVDTPTHGLLNLFGLVEIEVDGERCHVIDIFNHSSTSITSRVQLLLYDIVLMSRDIIAYNNSSIHDISKIGLLCNEKTVLVGLGIIGLVILKWNTRIHERNTRKLVVEDIIAVIPYTRILDKDKLLKILSYYGIKESEVNNEVIDIILNKAKNTPKAISEITRYDEISIKTRWDKQNIHAYDPNGMIKYGAEHDVVNMEYKGFELVDFADTRLAPVIRGEIINLYSKARLLKLQGIDSAISPGKTEVIGNSINTWNNGIQCNTERLQRIAEYLLAVNGILDEDAANNLELVNEVTKLSLYEIRRNTNEMVIAYPECSLVIDINAVIKAYKARKEYAKSIKQKVGLIDGKNALLGVSTWYSEDGILKDWDDGEVIEQTDILKGIEVTDANRHKHLHIIAKDYINIIYKARYSCKVIIYYRPKDIDKIAYSYGLLKNYFEIRFDLSNIESEDELEEAFGIIMRKLVNNTRTVTEDGKSIVVREFSKEISGVYLANYPLIFYGTEAKTIAMGENIASDITEYTMGIEKVSKEIKDRYMARYIVMLKKIKNKANFKYSAMIVTALMGTVYKDNKEMIDSYIDWLASTGMIK